MQPGASTLCRFIHTTVKGLHLNRIVYRILSITSHVPSLLNVLALFVTSNLNHELKALFEITSVHFYEKLVDVLI